jgi:hypothetical protein
VDRQVAITNSTLVKTIYKYRQQKMTVKNYYASNTDVVIQIMEEIKNLESKNMMIHVRHVKGHQDDNKKFEDLSREAQLNVVADQLATGTEDQPTPAYTSFPANKANLQIQGQAITADMTHQLRQAYLSQNMREYLIEKHSWKQNVPDLIWWKVHSSAISKLRNSETIQIHKYMYNRLPTNHRKNIYNSELSGVCSECNSEIETQDHVIQCKSEIRQTIRDELETKLLEACDKNKLPKEMTTAFMGGVQAWIRNQNPPDIRQLVPNASRQLKKTYNEQTLIGWDQVAKGRIATSWSQFINHVIDQNQDQNSNYSTAETWGIQVIGIMWKHVLLIWTARNNTEHGSTPQDKTHKKKEKLEKEVEKIKNCAKVSNAKDQNYIETPTEELKLMTVSQMIAWIRNSKILQAIDNKKKSEECRRMNIQQYLTNTGRRDVQSRQHIPNRDPGSGYISL